MFTRVIQEHKKSFKILKG